MTTTHLVTGASGFVGARLVEQLKGDVHALVQATSDTSRIEQVTGLTIWRHDGSADNLAHIIKSVDPDRIYHLAAYYVNEHHSADISLLIEANVKFGTMVLDATAKLANPIFIHAGTFFEQSGGIDVPLNLYTATKLAFNQILAYYTKKEGVRSARLLLHDVYGPRDTRGKFIDVAIEAMMTGQELKLPIEDPKLDLVHIDDVVNAFIVTANSIASTPAATNAIYAVSSDQPRSLREIINSIEKVIGQKAHIGISEYQALREPIGQTGLAGPPPNWKIMVPFEVGVRQIISEKNKYTE